MTEHDAEILGLGEPIGIDASAAQREQLFKNHPEAWERIQRLMIERGMVWIRPCSRGKIKNAYWEFGSWAAGGHLEFHGVIE